MYVSQCNDNVLFATKGSNIMGFCCTHIFTFHQMRALEMHDMNGLAEFWMRSFGESLATIVHNTYKTTDVSRLEKLRNILLNVCFTRQWHISDECPCSPPLSCSSNKQCVCPPGYRPNPEPNPTQPCIGMYHRQLILFFFS